MKRLLSGRPRTLMALAAALLSASLLYTPATGATEASAAEAGAVEAAVLRAPTDLTATYASGSIHLGFTRWNYTRDVIRHEYRSATTETDLATADWHTLIGGAGSGWVSGLASGQTHHLQVRAVGASGPSDASNTASVAIPDGPQVPDESSEAGDAEPGEAEPGEAEPGGTEPGEAEPGEAEPGGTEPGKAEAGAVEAAVLRAPTDLTATYASDSIHLGFTRWNYTRDVIRHEYRSATTGTDLATADWHTLIGGAGSGSVSGLAQGQTHYLQVRAVGASGPSDASNTASVAIPDGPQAPYESSEAGAVEAGGSEPGEAEEGGTEEGGTEEGGTEEGGTEAGGTEEGEAEEGGTEAAVLRAPAGLTATYASGSILLGFTRWNPAAEVIRHEYRSAMTEADLASADWHTLIGGAGSGWVSGLASGQTHHLQVRAVGASSPSGASNTASVAMPDGPQTPYRFSAEHARRDRVNMYWYSPTGGYPRGTTFEFKIEDPRGRIDDSWRTLGGTSWTFPRWGRTGVFLHSGNMTMNTTLKIQMRAVTDGLASTPSSEVSVNTTLMPAPTVDAESAGATSIRLRWHYNNDDFDTAEGWQYRYAVVGQDMSVAEWVTAPGAFSGFMKSYTVGNLERNTRYKFELRAIGGGQVGDVAEARARTHSLSRPNAPSGLEAHAVSSNPNAIRLTWLSTTPRDIPSAEHGVLWTYRWKEGSGAWSGWLYVPGGAPPSETARTVTITTASPGGAVTDESHDDSIKFKPNTEYSVQLSAYNEYGQGGWSNTATVTTAEVPTTETYKVEMTRISGDRWSPGGVEAATKNQLNAGNACDDITVTVPLGSDDSVILAATDAASSCHSINTGSRYFDAGGNVHNFGSGKRTYWAIKLVEEDDGDDDYGGADDGDLYETFKVELTEIDGDRSSVAGVKAATKRQLYAGNACYDITVTVEKFSYDSVILAAADDVSNCHIIHTSSRYIDADGEVHNFRSGEAGYWTIKRIDKPADNDKPRNFQISADRSGMSVMWFADPGEYPSGTTWQIRWTLKNGRRPPVVWWQNINPQLFARDPDYYVHLVGALARGGTYELQVRARHDGANVGSPTDKIRVTLR